MTRSEFRGEKKLAMFVHMYTLHAAECVDN